MRIRFIDVAVTEISSMEAMLIKGRKEKAKKGRYHFNILDLQVKVEITTGNE